MDGNIFLLSYIVHKNVPSERSTHKKEKWALVIIVLVQNNSCTFNFNLVLNFALWQHIVDYFDFPVIVWLASVGEYLNSFTTYKLPLRIIHIITKENKEKRLIAHNCQFWSL